MDLTIGWNRVGKQTKDEFYWKQMKKHGRIWKKIVQFCLLEDHTKAETVLENMNLKENWSILW